MLSSMRKNVRYLVHFTLHKVAHAAGKENDPSHALTKCRLERKRKVADKMRSLRASKDTNAEPPAKQKSTGRDEKPTDSQMIPYTKL
ncbi:hypothetical protein P5673_008530 [Acropora cervicornis]|uniref:Uncharacterized protein n=1 Tax=Acropora cervicornis TaxID=6130 RepID=A0AAD9QUD8_ACRCE|nr:hypothetical protein P5673_008530 [Acropora cervicornis]